tara:strand:+ start:4725 stop:4952 length:228 start_codon:yes stop_codon:yes gene_type:complete
MKNKKHMGDINTTDYYLRVESVLLSCNNILQIKNALTYIELYYKLSNDDCGYDILLRKYDKLYEKMNINEEPKDN